MLEIHGTRRGQCEWAVGAAGGPQASLAPCWPLLVQICSNRELRGAVPETVPLPRAQCCVVAVRAPAQLG